MSQTVLLADAISKEHHTGFRHPERPERFDAVLGGLWESGVIEQLSRLECRAATEDEVALCHSREYIELTERDVAAKSRTLSTGDTTISARSRDVALKAVGALLTAVDAVMGGKAKNAFCVVRPPGHHATPDRGMGFCIFNNVAIAARYAQRLHGIERVLIVDWDVHHGNGTHDIFYSDPSVFFFSTHQSPWYPGTGMTAETGDGAGQGTTLNCPFPSGSGRAEIYGSFQEKLRAAARSFRPDLVLVSAGFDSRLGDPLGEFTLRDDDFRDLTNLMLEVAHATAGGKLVSVLEGGYNLDGLASASAAHVQALASA